MRILLIISVLMFAGCASVDKGAVDSNLLASSGIDPDKYLDYQPIDPLPVAKVEVFNGTSIEGEYWAKLDAEAKRKALPNQSSAVSVSKSDYSGKIEYLGSSVSGDTGSYKVVMDYMKYRVESIYDTSSGEYLGVGKVGVGLRITADIETSSVGINMASLLSIGAEAKAGNLSGGIVVDVIGIDSKDVTNLLPLTSEIDQSSIQSALQSLASIKTKIFEDGVEITPHLVALKQAKPDQKSKLLLEAQQQESSQAKPTQQFNLVSIRIAENFMSGELSYTDADFAMNGVWPVMLDYIMKNDIPLVEPCYAIYEAFDQGEYDHKDGSDPVEKHTKPLLIEVLANA